MNAPMGRLCVCVDDLGLHSGINEAAFRLVDLSRIHAVACMVGAPQWASAMPHLRRLANRIDIGLHLDLTQHPLLGPARSLAGLLMACHARLLARDRVRAEIRAQLDSFEDALGFTPAFVDGHQHVHQFPVVRAELVGELLRRGARPWLRGTRSVVASGPSRPHRATAKHRLIEALGAEALARLARRHGFAQNRALLGIYDFDDRSRHFAQRVATWLREVADGDLLMCHASVPAAASDPLLPMRIAEFELLRSDAFTAMLADAGITLARMSTILGVPAVGVAARLPIGRTQPAPSA